MIYPSWPSNLPEPQFRGYQSNDELPIIRTEMESGPARVHRTSSSYVSKVSCSIHVDPLQATTFRSFLNGPANAGADWFLMTIDTGAGKAIHRVRFLSVNHTHLSRGHKKITFSVETDEQVISYM